MRCDVNANGEADADINLNVNVRVNIHVNGNVNDHVNVMECIVANGCMQCLYVCKQCITVSMHKSNVI